MSRSQHYLDALLSGVPLEELSAFEHRAAFQQVKERLSGAEDVAGELKALYSVNNFSELALQLLWIANRVEQEPAMLEPTIEEQTLVLSLFRHAIGDAAITEQSMESAIESPVEPPVSGVETEMPVMETSEPIIEPTPEVTSEPTIEPEPAPSSDFAFGEEAPKSEAAESDPFSMLTQSEPTNEAAPEADAFGLSTPTETPTETPAEEDPFAALRATAEVTEEPSAFTPTTTEEPAAPELDFSAATEESTQNVMQDFPSEPPTESVGEETVDFPPDEATPPPVAASATASQAGEGSPEIQFAKLVERFSEAVSSGIEGRDTIKDEMLAACSAVLANGSMPEDFKKFCQVITDFISYIYENGFVDDIRVMNLLSNVPDPVWAWAKADDASRPGMMEAAYDTLREFKSLFE